MEHASQVCACACLQTLKPRLRLEASTTVELVRGISRVRAWLRSKETDRADRDHYMSFILQLYQYILWKQKVGGSIPGLWTFCEEFACSA